MKTCNKCGKRYGTEEPKCPHCGEQSESGVFQTSTILISRGGAETVYRSVDDVPAALRTKLLRSTNSANSATILIADRRGRKEVAKTVRSLPNAPQKKLLRSLATAAEPEAAWWKRAADRRILFAAVVFLALAISAFVLLHHWQ